MATMISMPTASECTGLPYSALRRLILEGQYTGYIRVGSKYYINKEQLEEFLNSPAGSNGKPATVAGVRR